MWWNNSQTTFITFALLLQRCLAIWPFEPKRFTQNSLVETGRLGIDKTGRVVAFGDINGDQFTDIIVVGDDGETITPYAWDHDNFQFQPSPSIKHTSRITNIVPADFNNDGQLDLLVMSKHEGKDEIVMSVYFSNINGHFGTQPTPIPSSTISQPMLLDSNGDMKLDLLGLVSANQGGKSPLLRLWKNVWNETAGVPPLFELVDPNLDSSHTPCIFPESHSNAYLDLDGDCLADIFLTCEDRVKGKYFQIWLNEPADSNYRFSQEGQLPKGAGHITFADIDRDGTIDMIFPTCESIDKSTGVGTDCSINIAYNKQLPLCTSSKQTACRRPNSLCTRDPDFLFDLSVTPQNDAFATINISTFSPSSSLLMSDVTHDPPIPVPIRVGDLSLDGFPDLIAIIATPSRGGIFGIGADFLQTPVVLSSVPCSRGVLGCSASGQGRRGFNHLNSGVDALRAIEDARGVAVLDLDEDGTLDILVLRTGKQNAGTSVFIHNNFFYDAFFLKAMVLNRPCDMGVCQLENGTTYQAFGVSYHGASYKYTVQDNSGRRSAAQVAQLPQTSYHALNTPYAFFGLGRTNNYIENLFVGSTKKGDHFINMEGVIPNSKLVIIPSPPGEKGNWKKELFLRPGEWISWVTFTLVLATALLAIIVFVFHLNEKRADETERRRASHHINFDAL